MASLIAFIAQKHALPRENLATEILAEILRAAKGSVLQDLLGTFGWHLSPSWDCQIHTQTKGKKSFCIPDIHVQDEDNNTLALIESKFQAGFTRNQPNSYLNEISEGALLLFVVPSERCQRAFDKLVELCRSHDVSRKLRIDKSKVWVARVDGRILAVASWEATLRILEQSAARHLSKQQHQRISSDIEQLWRFCDVAEKETFPPLTPRQIAGIGSSSLIHHLTWFTRELVNRCLAAKLVNEDRSSKRRRGIELHAAVDVSVYYGQDLILGKVKVWIGFYGSAWEELGKSPIWIEFNQLAPRIVDHLRKERGRDFVIQNHLGSTEERTLIAIPLVANLGQEEALEKASQFLLDLKVSIEMAAKGGQAKAKRRPKIRRS
jgi:hypothetical protein